MRGIVVVVLALFAAAALLLAFPELLPAEHRVNTTSWLTAGSLVTGLFALRGEQRLSPGVGLFAITVLLAWWMTPERDAIALRHFSGIGLGVMTAGLVARWCHTERRLILIAALFSLAAAGVLLRGGASAFHGNLAAPATRVLVPEFDPIPLPLPGTESGEGHVNTNALAGTAVMVIPLSAALAFAASKIGRTALTITAGSATAIAGVVILVTASRSAAAAATLTMAALALRWRTGRRRVLIGLVIVAVSAGIAAYAGRLAAPAQYDRQLSESASLRIAILQDGLERLWMSPWLGIGISQFRSGPRASTLGDEHVAHAHNIALQVALDVGLLGLAGYLWTFGLALWRADRAAVAPTTAGRIAAGAGLSLVAVHLFGVSDAIALGAKVGVFQWWALGLAIAASRLGETNVSGAGTT